MQRPRCESALSLLFDHFVKLRYILSAFEVPFYAISLRHICTKLCIHKNRGGTRGGQHCHWALLLPPKPGAYGMCGVRVPRCRWHFFQKSRFIWC